jgi:hypothetical protein
LHSQTVIELFVQRIKAALGAKALGKRTHKVSAGFELRKSERSYNAFFAPQKSRIGFENANNLTPFPLISV